MEPITHLLTGATLARAGFNRKTVLATATMTLAAEAPDIDAFMNFGGRIFGFEHHRGFTHTFAGVPLVALLVVAVMYVYWQLRGRHRPKLAARGAPSWGVLFLLACLAGLSHILLDFSNNYGVRPFGPFSYRWYSWDIVFIVEPVLWVLLVAGLAVPSLFALVSEEVGVRRKPGQLRGRLGAVLALVGVLVTWGVRDYEHRRAVAALEALNYQGEAPLRVSAFPYPVTPFTWFGVVETRNAYHTMDVDSLGPVVDSKARAQTYFKPEETPVTLAAKQSRVGRVFLDWAQYPRTEVEHLVPPESGYLVRLYDVRYLYPERSRGPLGAWVLLNSRLRVVAQNFGWRDAPQTHQREIRGLALPDKRPLTGSVAKGQNDGSD